MPSVYIAASWRNEHAVVMLTKRLREIGFEVRSFVENNYGEGIGFDPRLNNFKDWCASDDGRRAFEFDTDSATTCDCVVYIAPSGQDAWAEIGAAWSAKVPVYGLWAKGECVGLMRRMVKQWFVNYESMLDVLKEEFRL